MYLVHHKCSDQSKIKANMKGSEVDQRFILGRGRDLFILFTTMYNSAWLRTGCAFIT